MDGMRLDSPAARHIVAALTSPFVLVDVGCSGGIAAPWSVFGDSLQALAFDPMVAEIERLSRAETRPGVRYRAAFIGAPDDHPVRQPQPGAPFASRDPSARLAWSRSSRLRDTSVAGLPPVAFAADFAVPPAPSGVGDISPPFTLAGAGAAGATDQARDTALMDVNQWHRTALADRTLSLPQAIADEGLGTVDFIKIDCDGPDFEILSSLEGALQDRQVLAVCAEVNFIGGAAANQHSFHNTDRLMRRAGFELMDLSVRHYASSALPFLYGLPHPHFGANLGGRPYQGDALYARDFGWTDTHSQAAAYDDDKLLKLAAVMALFGRVDQAAEVLLMFRGRLQRWLDIGRALDLLTAEVHALQGPIFSPEEAQRGYGAYMAAFQSDSPAAYDGLGRTAAIQDRALRAEAELSQTRAECDAALRAVADMRKSASWRLTAPLRALAGRRRR